MSGDTLVATTVDSPVGPLTLVGTGGRLAGLYMDGHRPAPLAHSSGRRGDDALPVAREQLAAYFAGTLRTFALDLAFSGTPFQEEVWTALREIPHGETVSYGDLARRVGRPAAVRAVAAANGRNPISIVVPCHRVVGAGGALTGYGGGIERKRELLAHEARGDAWRA